MIETIIHHLKSRRFPLQNEKMLQGEIEAHLRATLHWEAKILREFTLGPKDIIDFLIADIGIEVKVKGGKRAIYRQCVRYCQYDNIQSLILVTNISMGFPEQINNKNCYVVNLSKAWL